MIAFVRPDCRRHGASSGSRPMATGSPSLAGGMAPSLLPSLPPSLPPYLPTYLPTHLFSVTYPSTERNLKSSAKSEPETVTAAARPAARPQCPRDSDGPGCRGPDRRRLRTCYPSHWSASDPDADSDPHCRGGPGLGPGPPHSLAGST
jgi:hypothetical protein